MLRRHRQLRRQIHQLLDAALFAVGLWAAHLLRDTFDLQHYVGWIPLFGRQLEYVLAADIKSFASYLSLYFIIIPLAPLILEAEGFYNRPILFSHRQTFWMLAKASAWTVIAVILAVFLFRSQDFIARSVIIMFGFISLGLVFLKEELIRWGYKSKFGISRLKKRLILIGSKEDTDRLHCQIRDSAQEEIEILMALDLNETSVDDMVNIIHEHSANGVIMNASHTYFGQVEKAIQACEVEGVEALLIADFFKTQVSRTSLDDFYGRPVLVFHSGPEASWQGVAKQVIDFVGALFLLILLAVPLLVIALWIKLSSPGPVLFKQMRSGLNGHPFTMYKFRSMVTNAEQRKHELAAMNEMSGPVFKVTNDPRITSVGKIIRKWSIDELPQLWNVVCMEMSLVGPRPLPVEEVKRFDDFAHRRRLSVKPGLTCLWQVSGRNQVTSFDDWVRLDLEYIDNWSLWLDFKILWWTIPAVLMTKGAK